MLTFKGVLGWSVIVDGAFVKIVRKGILFSEKENVIPIRTITSVQVKKPGLLGGYIQFFSGDVGYVQAAKNRCDFGDKKSYSIALDMKKYIEEYKNESPSVANISAADEILKLKALMDDGIITLEEFNAKKKQLLGI